MARERTPKPADLPPGRSQAADPIFHPPVASVAINTSANMALTLRARLQLFRKPPDNHPLYAAVGRVAAEWAELEHRLDEIIWHLSGTTWPSASCITGQMIGHFPRFNAIIALVSLNRGSPELIKLIKTQQGKVSDLAEARARRVHDAWYVDQILESPINSKVCQERN